MIRANITILMGTLTKVYLNLIKNLVREYTNIMNKKKCTKENSERERRMDKESITLPMEMYMKVNFEMTKSQVMENRPFKMEIFSKENG